MAGKISYSLLFSLLMLCATETKAETGESNGGDHLIDVRRLIKDTLDIFRTYPAPPAMMKETANLVNIGRPMPVSLPTAPPLSNMAYTNRLPAMPIADYRHQQQQRQMWPAPPPTTVQAAPTINGIIAEPSQRDMEKLLHLPAEIMNRLAEDAGYVKRDENGRPFSSSSSSSDNMGKFFATFGGSVDQGKNPTTTTEEPIVAVEKPRIIMRGIVRDGKLMQVPVLAVQQSNGKVIYVAFEKLTDLSEALAKLVSTGEISSSELMRTLNAVSPAQQKGSTSSPPPEAIRSTLSTTPAASSPVGTFFNPMATNQIPNNAASVLSRGVERAAAASKIRDEVFPATYTEPQEVTNTSSSDRALATTVIGSSQNIIPSADNPAFTAGFESQSLPASELSEGKRKLVATESNAFVQEVEETVLPKKMGGLSNNAGVRAVTQPTIASTSPSLAYSASLHPAENEIVLNGKRYKLVAEGGTAVKEGSASVSISPIRQNSQPLYIPEDGPIQLNASGAAQIDYMSKAGVERAISTAPLPHHAPSEHIAVAATRKRPPPLTKPWSSLPQQDLSIDEVSEKRLTPEGAVMVNNGAFTDTRSVPKRLRPASREPSIKQYTLKELDELYTKQNKHEERMITEIKEEEKMNRSDRLRQQFKQQKKIIANKAKASNTPSPNKFHPSHLPIATSLPIQGDNKKMPDREHIAERICARVRYFARQFGQLDVKNFVRHNCHFIEIYYPEFKCAHVDEYVIRC